MQLDEFRSVLSASPDLNLQIMLPDGSFVPAHFHVTEVGRVQKDFIDCGGTTRSVSACVLQVWVAADVDHRLTAGRLAGILSMAKSVLRSDSLPVEVEYEGILVSQFPVVAVEATSSAFLLRLAGKHTNCLAQDRCGLLIVDSECGPQAGCC